MSQVIDQLGVLVRVRGRECDRRERAFIAERREHESREAELRRRRTELAEATSRHEAALRLRAFSPGDALLGDYLITRRSALDTVIQDEQRASEDLSRSAQELDIARAAHRRAIVRLDVLQDQLAIARRQETRRLGRKQEAAAPEGQTRNGVLQ
jgi:hypothetical protein